MNFDEFKKQNKPPNVPLQHPNPPQQPPRVPPPAAASQIPPGGLPAGYLANGYFDEKGYILPQVVVNWPKDISQKLDSAYPSMNVSQLRKFFTEVRHIEGQLSVGKNFDSLKGRVLKLDAYAADARKKNGVPEIFKQFIEQNLKWAVRTEKDFVSGFVPHFESIVAYFPKKQ